MEKIQMRKRKFGDRNIEKRSGRTVKSGGLWVFDNEIATVAGHFEDGDIVIVHDFDGFPMGRGYIIRKSRIRFV